MRVGELLAELGAVDPAELTRAIEEQPHTGHRLASLLIARGALDPDLAARALSTQHHVAAALQRHLDARDHRLAARIPAELARSYLAVPLARTRDDQLVVVLRDPRPGTVAALERALGFAIVPAVAAATLVERLVASVYGAAPDDEVDVDLDAATGPIALVDDELDTFRGLGGRLALVDLDDRRVIKDPTQSGSFAIPGRTGTTAPPPFAPPPPPPPSPASPPPRVADDHGHHHDHDEGWGLAHEPAPGPTEAPTLAATCAALDHATSRDEATDAAMAFLAATWSAALLLTIKEGAALGHRGHGGQLTPELIDALAVPLSATTIVRAAHDGRGLVTIAPAERGVVQERLARLLGAPRDLAAIPVVVGPRVVGVLVVGDPRRGGDARDLVALADGLATSYARVLRHAHHDAADAADAAGHTGHAAEP
jgi:hypothetical protein